MACDESFQEPEPLLWPYLKLFFSLLFLFQPLWICCSSTILGSFPFWGFSTDFFSCLFCSLLTYQLRSVQFSLSLMSDSLQPHGLQYTRLPCPSPAPGTCSNTCSLSQWCHPTISFCVVPFSPCLQSFPASRSFPVTQFFASGGQSIGASGSTSVLPMNIQGWFPLGWTGWISLQSKGLSRVISNTTVQKHQFFGAQLSL